MSNIIEMQKTKILTPKCNMNEIFISSKRNSPEKFYYKRAYKLFLDDNLKEIFICGLGSCVNKAIKTALFITESISNTSISSVETSTITQTDTFISESESKQQTDRHSNIIRIKLLHK
jgi:hypothetical protein